MRNDWCVLVFFLLCGCSSAPKPGEVSRKIASLDDNSQTVLDPGLETPLPNEEQKFNLVAQTVANFVTRQSELRAEHGQAPWATRDVHRKTHGCVAASLDISPDIGTDLNRQIANFIRERKAAGKGRSLANPLPDPISSSSDLGIFQPGARLEAVIRYSNGHPGNRHDREPDARGMAVKLLPKGSLGATVESTPADSLNRATLLDILTINFPTFFVNDPETYLRINQLFLKSAEDFRGAVSAQAFAAGSLYFTGTSRLERKLAFVSNGSIIDSPLYQKYYSMVPSRLGRHGDMRAVKYSFVPEACAGGAKQFSDESATQWADWTRRRDFSLPSRTVWAAHETPPYKNGFEHDYLRDHLEERLHKGPACFALMLQLYRDQFSTNIEDSTDIWLSDEADRKNWNEMLKAGLNLGRGYYDKIAEKEFSPYIKVATLKIAPIAPDQPVENTETCENLSFSPWNGQIEFHKPLGVVSRMKRRVYNASRRTRHTINGLPTESWERVE